MRSQVLTAVRLKKTVFWDIALCSLVEADQCFFALVVEAVSTSEKSVTFFKTM
jgi:hypothetical protein